MRLTLAGVPLPFTKFWFTPSCALKEISILLGEGQGQLRICCETYSNCPAKHQRWHHIGCQCQCDNFMNPWKTYPSAKIISFLYSTKITLKKTKENWMVNCVVESSKDNNQSTISCSREKDLAQVIKIGKFSAKCQKLVGRRRNV